MESKEIKMYRSCEVARPVVKSELLNKVFYWHREVYCLHVFELECANPPPKKETIIKEEGI